MHHSTLPVITKIRRGFTLFEVAISLALVTFGVISVLMLFPSGIKAQQLARFQILASARAVEMVDIFSSATDASLMLDREGPHPWDTTTSYHAYAPDLEKRIATFRYGLFPLPPDIARRLDSDGDEIQRILDEGGYVYYSQPSATSGFNPVGARANMPEPNESQKIICAVVGYAQQNAIPALSYKDWPYHAPYPSPPMHIITRDVATSRPTTPWNVIFNGRNNTEQHLMLFEDTLPADNGEIALVFQAIVKGPDLPLTTLWVDAFETGGMLAGKNLPRSSGYLAYGELGGWIPDTYGGVGDGIKRNNPAPYDEQKPTLPDGSANPVAIDPTTGQPTTQKALARESALAYFALAKWYASRKGVSNQIADGTPLADDANLLTPANLFQSGSGNAALAVNAARVLAHAAMCVTHHFKPDGATDETISIGPLEVIRKGTTPYAGVSPPFIINKTIAHNYVDNAMKLGMRFAASYPYDWGSPRPLNRATMMDFPLFQYDPFESSLITPSTTYFSGYAYGTRPATAARPAKSPTQWKILSAQPIANLGRSMSYPSMNLDALWPSVTSTTPNRFTLARPFEPADRTRQIVFWAVDWQAYEDFETAPSAPVDASRYPKRSPQGANLSGNAAKPDILMRTAWFHDRHQLLARNPEKTLVFLTDTSNQPTGVELLIGGNDSMWNPENKRPDLGIHHADHPNAPMVFSGRYGADRNFNGTRVNRNGNIVTKIYGKLDRGPVPKSVRMRATLIGRFNFYDPRLPLVIR